MTFVTGLKILSVSEASVTNRKSKHWLVARDVALARAVVPIKVAENVRKRRSHCHALIDIFLCVALPVLRVSGELYRPSLYNFVLTARNNQLLRASSSASSQIGIRSLSNKLCSSSTAVATVKLWLPALCSWSFARSATLEIGLKKNGADSR